MATPLILAQLNGNLTYEDSSSGGVANGFGALRYRDGHTAGVQAALVEEGTTNLYTLPSFEGAGTPLANRNDVGSGQSSEWADVGTYSHKVVALSTSLTAGIAIREAVSAGSHTLSGTVHNGNATSRGYRASIDGTNGDTTIAAGDSERVSCTKTLAAGSPWNYIYSIPASTVAGDISYIDAVQLEPKDHETSYCDGSLGVGYSWVGTEHGSISTREAARIEIPMSAPNSVAVRYSEDGSTWSFSYLETLGTIGTYGSITHNGSSLVVTSDRALYVGPLFAFADTLSINEQTALESTPTWTFSMLVETTATNRKARVGGVLVDILDHKTKMNGVLIDMVKGEKT